MLESVSAEAKAISDLCYRCWCLRFCILMNANDAICQPISKESFTVHLACANTATLCRCLFTSCIPNEEELNYNMLDSIRVCLSLSLYAGLLSSIHLWCLDPVVSFILLLLTCRLRLCSPHLTPHVNLTVIFILKWTPRKAITSWASNENDLSKIDTTTVPCNQLAAREWDGKCPRAPSSSSPEMSLRSG